MLHPDWKKIVLKAWSMRLMAIGALLQMPLAVSQIMPDVAPYLPGLATAYFNFAAAHPVIFASLSLLSLIGAMLARVTPQKEFTDADQ